MRAFVGLGSNCGYEEETPAELLDAAVEALSGIGPVVARSSLYRTEPVGFAEQPAFLNAVVALETEMGPVDLLAVLLGVERQFGRDRTEGTKNGPRTLDLDLLLYGELVMAMDGLTVPHPRLAERRFVLAPLAEIAGQMVHPVLRKTMAELLCELPEGGENGIEAVQLVTRNGGPGGREASC